MKFVFIPAVYKGEISLSKELLERIKGKTIGLYGAVQFNSKFDKIIKQLEDNNVKVKSSKPDRTSSEFQILGCDCYSDSLNLEDVDAFLYIGDGMFHPKALVLSQRGKEFKEVISYDPIGGKFIVLTKEDLDKSLMRYKASLMKFLSSDSVGVIVSSKTGQEYLKNAIKLKDSLDKKCYVFVGDTIDYGDLENFPFVECWVNSACPRIGFDDGEKIGKPIININDAFNVKEILANF